MQSVFNSLYVWLLLGIVAIILIYFRKDKKQLFEEIQNMLSSNGLLYGIFILFILYCVFPITIPYSISYFFFKKK
jgi:presenilin-like A22 family membrane protease